MAVAGEGGLAAGGGLGGSASVGDGGSCCCDSFLRTVLGIACVQVGGMAIAVACRQPQVLHGCTSAPGLVTRSIPGTGACRLAPSCCPGPS